MQQTELLPIIHEWISTGSGDADALAVAICNQEQKKKEPRALTPIQEAHANGVRFGRPKLKENDRFALVVARWRDGEMSAVEAFRSLGMSKNTFYRRVKELEASGD